MKNDFLKYLVLFPAFGLLSAAAIAQISPIAQESSKSRQIETLEMTVQELREQIEVMPSQKEIADILGQVKAMEGRLEERFKESSQEIKEIQGSVGQVRHALTTVGSKMRPADVVWVSVCAALVFFMQAGFCLVELGFSRSKNVINVIMKNFVDFCVSCMGYVIIGFGLMYGASIAGFIGRDHFFLLTGPSDSGIWLFLLFQMMFAGTCATITSGAMAERTKFIGYVIFSCVVSTLIYPVAGHWVWGGNYNSEAAEGWLAALGFIDFAGSTVVHGVGGACALAGIIILGPRVGRFAADGSPRLIVGHNLPFATLGVFILWFGWFGFNGGSTMVADGYIGRILVNTNLAAATGGMIAMFSMWKIHGRPDLAITLNGALGGLVAITASCNTVSPLSAIIIGIVAGLLATGGAIFLEKMKLDDVVGAVPVHLFNGVWGTTAVAIFVETEFSFSGLAVQLGGSLACVSFAFVAAYAVFLLIDKMVGIRASDTEQLEGLDFHEHSATAYPDFTTTDQTL
jgi:Amt family ammonium transporter